MPNTALLIIDVQRGAFDGVLHPPINQPDVLIDSAARLLNAARSGGAPVVFIQHCEGPGKLFTEGTPQWALHGALLPQAGEAIVHKRASSAFEDTDLAQVLANMKADSLVIGLASRSYFGHLLRSGARIFLYEGFRRRRFGRGRSSERKGFLHAKTMVVDSWMGTIGSANMDMRSFRLNFELNAFVYERALCDQMARQFELDLAQASEYTLESAAKTPYPSRLAQQSARLMSPLL